MEQIFQKEIINNYCIKETSIAVVAIFFKLVSWYADYLLLVYVWFP